MAVTAGQTQGNEAEAANVLRSQGIDNPSSGLVRYVAYGDTGYSAGDAARLGLPLTQGILQGQFQEAIKPAVQSYEASIPEISQKYTTERTRLGGEKQPLIDRYQNLVTELTGRETKETTARARALSGLYSQRGIPLESPSYQQDLANKLGDISQFYGVQRKDVGLAKEADIRDIDRIISQLTGQEVEQVRTVRNAIAQLQAGAGQSAVTGALDLYRTQQAQQFESRFDPLERLIKEKQAKGEGGEYKFADVLGGGYLYNPKTGEVIRTLKDLREAAGGEEGPPE